MYVLLLPGGSSNRSMDTKERRQKDIYNWRFHWGGAYDTGHHQGFHRYKPSQFRMLKKVKVRLTFIVLYLLSNIRQTVTQYSQIKMA